MIWINSWGLAAQHQIIGTPYMEKPYPWRKDMLPNTVFFSMTKLFTWEIIAQHQSLQARHLRKNVSKTQFPSLLETFKQEILWFMTISVLWIRILASPLNCDAVSLLSCWQQQIQNIFTDPAGDFHVLYSTASWLNLFLASILWLYETIQLNIWKSKK